MSKKSAINGTGGNVVGSCVYGINHWFSSCSSNVSLQRALVLLDILDVAKHLSTKDRVWRVGCHLGMREHEIQKHFTNNRHNIMEAALDLLHDFRRTMATEEEAFQKLWDALVKSGLQHVAQEVLAEK